MLTWPIRTKLISTHGKFPPGGHIGSWLHHLLTGCWHSLMQNKASYCHGVYVCHLNMLQTKGKLVFWTPCQVTSYAEAIFIIPPEQRSCWGVYWFQSVRLSARLSRLQCPLCTIYSSGWILSILATNDHYYERVCRTQWPLTLTYIFTVIWPWLRKLCPLCSIYSCRWILFIFGTNDHYH